MDEWMGRWMDEWINGRRMNEFTDWNKRGGESERGKDKRETERSFMRELRQSLLFKFPVINPLLYEEVFEWSKYGFIKFSHQNCSHTLR